MLQVALKRKVSALLGKRHLSPTTQVSNEWGRIEWWRRMFLPADVPSRAFLCHEEKLECREFVTETVSVQEKQKLVTLRVGETQKYRRDPDCCPQEFRNQRKTFIEDEEKVKCDRCKGKGKIDCSPEVPCPNCKGRRTRNDLCFSCKGSGRAGQDQREECWACRGRGARSEDCAACANVYSGSSGRVKCHRCGGSGWVLCRACAGAGEKVQARLVTRTYTLSAETHFQSGRPGTDEFCYGLAPRHFKSLPGNLVHQEIQTPSKATAISQRLSVFSYRVESNTYSYKGADFHLNQISSDSGARLVTNRLPWSKPKLALAGILGAFVVSALSALSLVS